MSDAHPPRNLPKHVLDAVAAGLFPSLSADDRRERTLRLLAQGLLPLAPWGDGRMVYVEGAPKA